jgi:hypothetical protein
MMLWLVSHAVAVPLELTLRNEADVNVPVFMIVLFALSFWSCAKQFQPVVAAGKPTVPEFAVPPVPIKTVNAQGPLLDEMEGEVPKPELIVGVAPELHEPRLPGAGEMICGGRAFPWPSKVAAWKTARGLKKNNRIKRIS